MYLMLNSMRMIKMSFALSTPILHECSPTFLPFASPTATPSKDPMKQPSEVPYPEPSSANPTKAPSASPTILPSPQPQSGQTPAIETGELLEDLRALAVCFDGDGNLIGPPDGAGWPGRQWLGSLDDAKIRCAALEECRFLVSWGCNGRNDPPQNNWKVCAAEPAYGAENTGTCALPVLGHNDDTSSCTICTDIATQDMIANDRACDTWKWAYTNRCRYDAIWREKKWCQQSCYTNFAGYVGDVCC